MIHVCVYMYYCSCTIRTHTEMSATHVLRDAQDTEHQTMKTRMEAALSECEQTREVCVETHGGTRAYTILDTAH